MPHSRHHTESGFTSWIAILFAAAILAGSFFLFAEAQASEPSDTPDGLVRLSEIEDGALLLRTMEAGRYIPAPLVATSVEIDIAGPVVRATVTQRFENPSQAWVEGIYVFPLPDSSGVDRLRMMIGDRFIEGQIHERVEARRIYEEARDAGQRASLIEQERPNMFTTSVANIGPGETIIVQIEYQDVARMRDGRFEMRFPMGLTPRYIPQDGPLQLANFDGNLNSTAVPDAHRITPPLMLPDDEPMAGLRLPVDIEIRLDAGFALGNVASLYHATTVDRSRDGAAIVRLADGPVPANRDFVLTWTAAERAMPQAALFTEEWDGATYLLAQIIPPAELGDTAPRRDRETIFVIDNSGSMAGESMRQARDALVLALDRLSATDRFNVIRFDDTMETVFSEAVDATPDNVRVARRFVSGLQADGGTEMLPALRAALIDHRDDGPERVRQIVFLTDGAIGNETQLFDAIARGLGQSRLFTVGIGSAPNTHFMTRAARVGRGSFTHIGDVNEVTSRMGELFEALERPVMTDLDALFPSGSLAEIWPAPLPDLYYGEPVLLTARLDRPGGTFTVEGRLAGSQWTQTLPLSDARPASGVAALWARNRITGIEESRFQGVPSVDIDRAVLQTALDFSLVSRLTSLVAVDVTPARDVSDPLARREVPNMIPDGWDFRTVMETEPVERHAALDPDVLERIQAGTPPGQSVDEEDGLPLPQTATLSQLLMLAGALLMLFAGLGLVAGRRLA
ncbi:marine proteobacterial sortase target protein [Hyphobacterium marinum]|uniref:Marine proteobacterial sortase target protein n=1 Tax=Hyphobacterium marinum TaxID=3116574 RepID=A0ABU7LX57_9PROT|nr:marine proteobacterial sortase target protein [Hyphobacterium sp. Y6023]MEE2566126.1 marine proteobacterial sortase target protein [Hyphobacterium sp. Y6023]